MMLRALHSTLLLSFVSLASSSTSYAAAKPAAEMQAVLDTLAALGGQPIETLSAQEARKQPTAADAVKALAKAEKRDLTIPLTNVSDIQIDGADGQISARIYKPASVEPMPVVVYFHGGGFVIASNDVYDATPRALAFKTNSIFVSVEYRKGPEFKFPAAHDDAFAAYQWVVKNAASFGGDPKRIAVAGESAGGNLAVNVAIAARDKHVFMPLYEVVVYPVAGKDMNTESYVENADAKPLNKAMMKWFFTNYLSAMEQAQDTRLNLLGADLHGLAPATVITAEIDPLRSEGATLAERMKAAGVDVTYMNYEGVTHEFFGMAGIVPQADAAQQLAGAGLMKALQK